MKKIFHIAAFALVAATALLRPVTAQSGAPTLAYSLFDNPSAGVEGWMVYGDVQGVSNNFAIPSYNATQGAGAAKSGYIYAKDKTEGKTWYYIAPSKFLGDKSKAFGGALEFDIKQSEKDDQYDNVPDILIQGSRFTLVYKIPGTPNTKWTHYRAPINSQSGWRINSVSGTFATQSQIQEALKSVKALWIRGEYRSGEDIGSLDNVFLYGAAN